MPSLLHLDDEPSGKRKAEGPGVDRAAGHRTTLLEAMKRFPFREPEFRNRRVAAKAAFLLLLGASSLFGIMLGLVLVYTINLPQMDELERYRPSTTTDLYDIHGKVFGSFASERRVVVPYTEFPKNLHDAILSIEDKDFESNGGINLVRVVGAAWKDMHSHGRSQGASTLTMQLARNLFLSSEKTYGRKLQEIFLTLQIERHFTKQQIFSLYANQIYVGRGTYGFEAASQYYFSKHVRDLTLPEAALLAALPKGPEEYSPVRHPERALKRRNLVLSEMLEDKKISAADAESAKAAPLGLNIEKPAPTEAPYFVEEVRRQLEHEYGTEEVHGAGLRVYTTMDLDLERVATQAVLDGTAAYERRHGWKGNLKNVLTTGTTLEEYTHQDWAVPIAPNAYYHALVTDVSPTRMTVRIGSETSVLTYPDWAWTGQARATELAQAGDIVYVKVANASDAASQAAAAAKLAAATAKAEADAVETALAAGLPPPKFRKKVAEAAKPTGPHVLLEQDSGAQASFMAVDNSDGEVLAMVGGRDYYVSQFNRATQAQRQTGSSFKPYVYTTALENGMKPTDTVLDTPTTFYTASGPYTPHNYETGQFAGSMTLINAFAESRNIPALRLADKFGIKKVIETAHRFGVTSNIPNFLPVAIGSADITLAEQVGAYSVFPNDGIRIAPHYIRRVAQADGLPLPQKTPEVREVISTDIAREMMILLQAVVQHGTAAAASTLKHPFGGKTGTTNNFTDAWFLGFSPSITAGAWVGFDDPSHSLGDKETGAKAALPIWMDFMKVAIADHPNEQFARPNAPKRQIAVDMTEADNETAPEPPKTGDEDPDDESDQPTAPKPVPPVVPPVVMPQDTAPAKPIVLPPPRKPQPSGAPQ